MILDKLVLHNFCLYRGRQELDLAPVSQDKPVVLVGGLNGGGKTTVLDAVQLALYGPRAHASRRDNHGYESYLRACTNRGVDAKDGASVAIHFRYVSEGMQHNYEVRRQWEEKKSRIKETVSVSKDGEYQKHLSLHWSDIVEEMIPLGISRLFFFDAEQVRFLADDDSSHQALGTAVKSLLGLDLAERLVADASILEARLTEQMTGAANDPELRQMQKELAAKDQEVQSAKQELATLENSRQRAVAAREKAEEQFAAVGGEHWLQREARRKELESLRSLEKVCRVDLIRLSGNELPFAMIPDLIECVAQQDASEQGSREARIIRDVLKGRDKSMVAALRQKGVQDATIKLLVQIQDADRRSRDKLAKTSVRHGLSENARHALNHLRNGALTQRQENVVELLERLQNASKKREHIERSLSMTPDDESVTTVFESLKNAMATESQLNSEAGKLEGELKSLQLRRDDLDRKVATIRRKKVDLEIDGEQAGRMIQLAVRTQETIREFQRRATARKIDRLSKLVTESFQFLLRKQAFVERVEIDPESFGISLYGATGEVISKERLSEGEKQIFAISVLWGLAKASPRPLPAIIDTPMARLDMEHRKHLVERYFPHASHQVIVLSTDAEVDETFYPRIQPSVSHEYYLNYDEATQMTTAEDGYFPALRKRRTKVSS